MTTEHAAMHYGAHRTGTECPSCGPTDHQPIPEDEAHCPCGGSAYCDCPCHATTTTERTES